MQPKIKRLTDSLNGTSDGVVACNAVNKLAIHAEAGDADAIAALASYTTSGLIGHVRGYACARLAEIVNEKHVELLSVFQNGLADDAIRYWSILGYSNIAGRAAYRELVKVACDHLISVEQRGHAVKCLALTSGQLFDRQCPSDPGEWDESHIRIAEIIAWENAGYPDGPGHRLPTRHPALDNPQTPWEKAVSRLDKRLAKFREKDQDAANPSDWLAVANTDDLDAITGRWTLPAVYLDFLTRFSPVNVIIESQQFYNGGLQLFGATELISAQDGYAFNPIANEPIDDWPTDYIVIASHAGDPFVLDLASSNGNDAPVLTAEHGRGTWDFERDANSFADFVKSLTK